MKKILFFVFLMSIVIITSSCDKNDGAYYPVPSEFSVTPAADQSIGTEGGTIVLTIATVNLGWWIETSESWCTASSKYGSGAGEVTLTIGKNTTGSPREATISVHPTFGKEPIAFTVKQQ